jgi:hypothetical protein
MYQDVGMTATATVICIFEEVHYEDKNSENACLPLHTFPLHNKTPDMNNFRNRKSTTATRKS